MPSLCFTCMRFFGIIIGAVFYRIKTYAYKRIYIKMNILKFLKPKACVDFVYDDNTARQALEKMKNHSFTAVPVIDREGRYVKTLAEGDFLWFDAQ